MRNALAVLPSGAAATQPCQQGFPTPFAPRSGQSKQAPRGEEEEEEEKAASGRSQTRRRIQARLCSQPPASPEPSGGGERERERRMELAERHNPGCVKPAGLKMAGSPERCLYEGGRALRGRGERALRSRRGGEGQEEMWRCAAWAPRAPFWR